MREVSAPGGELLPSAPVNNDHSKRAHGGIMAQRTSPYQLAGQSSHNVEPRLSLLEQRGHIAELATELAKAAGKLDRMDLAVAAAEAELELARIMEARTALIESRLSSLIDEPHQGGGLDQGHTNDADCLAAQGPRQSSDRTMRAIVAALPQLEKLERYERRALSHHKQAWRRLLD